jgi:uncharacterized membrane protein
VQQLHDWIEVSSVVIESIGVGIIIVGLVLSTVRAVRAGLRGLSSFKSFREDFGRALLLGLEVLIAGDIIRTVTIAPTLESIVSLGIFVLIRTFLSWSLIVELEGRWPWHAAKEDKSQTSEIS